MQYLLNIGAAGPGRDPRALAELAARAEAAGWDGMLLEDYLVYQHQVGLPAYNPWVVLAAMATATTRLLLGTLVTPLPRRRPWQLAAEAVALDHLSGGRVLLGVGAGDARDPSFAAAGEPGEARVLAERLDEGLALVAALWRGEAVTFHGKHYHLDRLQLAPPPLQRPRIPIWVGGDWRRPGVRRRLVRWDGCCLYRGTPGTAAAGPLTADDVRELVAFVAREREATAGFAICVGGFVRGADWERERANLRALAAAGATHADEWIPPGDPQATREAISRGPLRVDR